MQHLPNSFDHAKKQIFDYCHRMLKLRAKEMNSLVFFVALVCAVIFIPLWMEKLFFSSPLQLNFLNTDSLLTFSDGQTPPDTLHGQALSLEPRMLASGGVPVHPIRFDPNSLNTSGWKLSGLEDYKIKIIQHYLQRGGIFRRKQDVLKIYGFTHQDYLKVEPYLAIGSGTGLSEHGQRSSFPRRTGQGGEGQLNRRWDTRTFQWDRYPGRVPGAGGINDPKRPTRLILNLNQAGYDEFISLHLLESSAIWDIINFRKRNGPFTDIRELKNLHIVDRHTYNRLASHLTLKSP